MKIRTFELCAGYDSQLMAMERLKKKHSDFDYDCIGWSEIEPNAITLHNACFPSLSGKNFGDMTKIDWSKVADFDLLTYSTPCQSVSQAGKQNSSSGSL
jgi:DNA (cytosine-5)-methyltransferase 1